LMMRFSDSRNRHAFSFRFFGRFRLSPSSEAFNDTSTNVGFFKVDN
jgi:hypothetical protein